MQGDYEPTDIGPRSVKFGGRLWVLEFPSPELLGAVFSYAIQREKESEKSAFAEALGQIEALHKLDPDLARTVLTNAQKMDAEAANRAKYEPVRVPQRAFLMPDVAAKFWHAVALAHQPELTEAECLDLAHKYGPAGLIAVLGKVFPDLPEKNSPRSSPLLRAGEHSNGTPGSGKSASLTISAGD